MTAQSLPEVGQRIRLIEMPNDPHPIPAGTLGTIRRVNRLGDGRHQIFVDWDIDRSLMLVFGVDRFEIVQTYDVRLSEIAAYYRYEIEVEAASSAEACATANAVLYSTVAPQGTHTPAEGEVHWIHELYDAEGEELAVPYEHEEWAVQYPSLLAQQNEVKTVVREIDAFDRLCAEAQYTDVGQVWELLHAWRKRLHATLPDEIQHAITAENEALEPKDAA